METSKRRHIPTTNACKNFKFHKILQSFVTIFRDRQKYRLVSSGNHNWNNTGWQWFGVLCSAQFHVPNDKRIIKHVLESIFSLTNHSITVSDQSQSTIPVRLSRPSWLVTYLDGLPTRRWSPIQSTNGIQCWLTSLIRPTLLTVTPCRQMSTFTKIAQLLWGRVPQTQ